MRTVDVVVVGGGPAGSTCAWQLRRAGLDVIVLDRAAFPRTKLCAGWVTPQALEDLELGDGDYPRGIVTFDRLHVHWKLFGARPPTCQHSVRRYEFDDFLLRRSGAHVVQHKANNIRVDGDTYVVDETYRCRYIVGAGGTSCPVYRQLFHEACPRNPGLQTATLEQEFAYDWSDPDCHLWFFDDGLPGYSWYVPKANGYVNVGIGGMAVQLKRRDGHLRDYWQKFTARLDRLGLVQARDYDPSGYSYYLRDDGICPRKGNAFLVGDAAGLATVDLCEGIGPAIRSGRLAAESIVTGCDYSLESVGRFSGAGLVSRVLERRFTAAG